MLRWGRFSTLFAIVAGYILLSTLTRLVLLVWSIANIDFQPLALLGAFGMGFLYDLAVALSFVLVYNLYLLLLPKRWIGSLPDRIFTILYCFIVF
ncbi:MAG: LTA synthase family protein, partial [Flavihumibacter sp.]